MASQFFIWNIHGISPLLWDEIQVIYGYIYPLDTFGQSMSENHASRATGNNSLDPSCGGFRSITAEI
jgi:hypothetical protein